MECFLTIIENRTVRIQLKWCTIKFISKKTGFSGRIYKKSTLIQDGIFGTHNRRFAKQGEYQNNYGTNWRPSPKNINLWSKICFIQGITIRRWKNDCSCFKNAISSLKTVQNSLGLLIETWKLHTHCCITIFNIPVKPYQYHVSCINCIKAWVWPNILVIETQAFWKSRIVLLIFWKNIDYRSEKLWLALNKQKNERDRIKITLNVR